MSKVQHRAEDEVVHTNDADLVSKTERMSNLLEDIDALVSLISRRRQLERVSVAVVAREVWEDHETGDTTLHVESDGDIVADREWLGLAFDALFSNAIEHTGALTTVRVGAEGGVLYVEDDGPGLPFDSAERAGESGVTTRRDGSGYGLTVVEHVARAHKWTYRLRDGERGGVRIELVMDE